MGLERNSGLYIIAAILLLLSSFTVQAQTSWKGTVSTAWNTASNWTAGVPTASVDAVIGDASFTGSFQPTISNSATCKSLTINSTASPVLTISKSLTIAGDLNLNAGGTISHRGVVVTIKGNWNNAGTYTPTVNNARVNFAGVTQSINGASATAFRRLSINAGSSAILNTNISVANAFTVDGTFTPAENATPPVVSGGGSLNVGANGLLKVNAATFAGNYSLSGTVTLSAGSRVDYSATLVNQAVRENVTYSTLIISGSGVKTLAGNLNALNSTTATTGNITVNAGTLDLSTFTANRGTTVAGGTLTVSNGAILKIGGTNTFPANYATRSLSLTSVVEYAGANQTVSAQSYGNLTLSASTGAVVKTMPATDFTVSGNFSSNLGAGTSLSYTAASNITVSGNVAIGASTTFNGGSFTHNIAGNWVNSGTFTGSTSTVNMTGGGTSISGTGTHNFNNLSFLASNITAAAASSLNITGNLATSGPGSFTHAAGGTTTLSGTTKTITGTGIVFDNLTISGSVSTSTDITINGNLSVSGSLTASAGTFTLSGATKTISGAGTISFSGLSLSGSISTGSSFSIGASLVVSGSFSATAGTATFTGTSTLNGTANLFNVTLNGTSLQLSTNAVLGIAGTYTITAGSLNVTATTPNTVNYNGAGAQTVTGGAYGNLMLSNGSTKTAGGAVTVNGDLTIAASTTFSASTFTHTMLGNWINNGTFTASSGTIAFTGTVNSTISGATTFANLTLNKSSSSLELGLLSNVSVGTLNMTTGTMSTGSNTVTITTTRTGNGVIFGNIQRTHAFALGTSYAFESPNTTITLTGLSITVSSITVSVTKGAVADFQRLGAVNRQYTISITGLVLSLITTLRLHYEDDELNGNNESTMQLWRNTGSAWAAAGKASNSTTANYVEQTFAGDAAGRWTFFDDLNVVRWNGAVSSDWFTAANWTTVAGAPSLPPGINDIVEIGTAAFTNQPVINNSATVKSILFGSAQAANLSLTAGGALTVRGNVTGSWSADAAHTIQLNGQPLTVNGDLILSDGTAGHTISLDAGAATVNLSGALTQSGGANITFSGAGAFNIGNNFTYSSGTFTAGNSTVTYNGTATQLVGPVTYYNLVINKASGIAAVNSGATVNGQLSVTAGELDINSPTTVVGNVNISSGAILNGDGVTTTVGGNWNNSGFFVSLSGTVALNGTGAQSITATTFNNLTVNKASGTATLTGNVGITGNLSVNNGTLDLSTFTANRSAAGGTMTLASGTSLLAGGSNNFPANYTTYTLNTGSTVNYNGTGAQSVAGVSYGQLILSNGNTKTLAASATVNGDITISSGSTFSAGSFTIDLGGNWSNSGTFSPGTGTVVLNGSSKTITGNTTFNKVTVYGSYAVSGSNITYNGLLLITSSGSFDGGSGLSTISGDLTNQGVLIANGTATFTGTVVQTIRFINAVTSNSSGIINFNGTVSPVLSSTSTPTYATLNINNTGGVTASVGWIVGVAFNIGSGATFNGGASNHTIIGTFSNSGTVTSSGVLNFTPSTAKTYQLVGTAFSSTGIVIFGGTGAITVNGTPTALNNVSVTNSGGVTPNADWNIGGNFILGSNGIFNAGSRSFTVGGNLTADGTLNGGTSLFTMSSATGQLSANPNTIFYDLTITGTITLNSDVNISHNFTNNNIIDASSASLNFTGSAPGVITGSAASFALAQFTILKSSTTVTLSKNITNIVELDIESGTLDMGAQTLTQDVGGNLTIADNATLKIGGTSTLPTFDSYTLDTLSTVDYAGSTQSVSSSTAYGNLTISAAGSKTASAILRILNNFTLTNGTFVPGSFADTLGGNWTMSSGTFTNTGSTIVLNGAGTQTISSTGAFNHLTLKKTSGSTILSSGITVNGTLNFLTGVIQTGSNTLIMPAAAAVTGAGQSTGWVFGRLQKNVATGTNVSRTFEIGDAANYTPATALFASVSTAGNLLGLVTTPDHPNLASSGIDASKSVNRYWTLTNSGIVFTTVGVTLNWRAADVDAGANTANFKAGTYNGSTWTLPTVASPLATSIQATGLTSFSDIAVGELLNTALWTGAVSTNWFVSGNWSTGTIPNTSVAITIPSALSNYPLVSSGTAACNAITIQSGASVTVSNATLQISGAITNSGSISASSGTVEMNGSTAQTIPAALFSSNTIRNLIVNNSAGVTLGGVLSLSGILTPTSGNFSTGGNLTLLSTAAQTALISGSGTGSVLGNVTMQRYLPSAFGYRYISSPFQAATVNELANDLNLNATFPTLYYYDENLASLGWVRYTTASNVLNPMQGYAANFGAVATARTVDISGVVNSGVRSLTLYNHNRTYTLGFNLAGNPYPSPVDWDAASGWTRSNIDNAVYYFNPGTTDQYTGSYSSYINGVSSDGVANNIIPAMQGFFVHVSNGAYPVTGTLSVNNNARVNNLTPSYHRITGADAPLLRLEAGYNDEAYPPDPVVIYFEETAGQGFEQALDALKLMNTDPLTPSLYTLAADGQALSISALPYLQDSSTTIPLLLQSKRNGWITFYARDIVRLPAGWHIYLKDAVANRLQDLQRNPQYRLYLDEGNYDQRFSLVFSRHVIGPPLTADDFRAYSIGGVVHVHLPLPAGEQGQVSITSLLGQVIYQRSFNAGGHYELLPGCNTGIYMVNYFSRQGLRSRKILITNE